MALATAAHDVKPGDCLACAELARIEAEAAAGADNPEYDGTDAAHPAWWRGNDHAAAGLLALREALDHLLRWPCRQATDGDCVVHGRRELRPDEICAWAEAKRVLADTAPAAAEIEARIEQRGYERGRREASWDITEKYHIVRREQPATDEAVRIYRSATDKVRAMKAEFEQPASEAPE